MIDSMPRWFDSSFQDFLGYAESLRDLAFTSIAGMRRIIEYPYPSGVVLQGFKNHFGRSHTEIGTKYDQELQFATEEEKRGYKLLTTIFTVSAWDSLDYFILDFVADWFDNEPSARQIPRVARLYQRQEIVQTTDRRERDYLVGKRLADGLRRDTRAVGVEQFECVLNVLGLAGPVDPQTSESLVELHQVRNVLVHRRGVADERLLQTCPHLGFSPGNGVLVDYEDFSRYAVATLEYAKLLLHRVAGHYGIVR